MLRNSAVSGLAFALLLAACSRPKPPPAAAALSEEEPAGYVGYRFANRTDWTVRLVLEDTARKETVSIELDRPAQEVHIGRILKPAEGRLELPPEEPIGSAPTVVRLRPAVYKVRSLELRKGSKREVSPGSGELIPVEADLFTYIGSVACTQSATTRAFTFATAEYDPEELRGIEGRASLKVRVINLE